MDPLNVCSVLDYNPLNVYNQWREAARLESGKPQSSCDDSSAVGKEALENGPTFARSACVCVCVWVGGGGCVVLVD
jgi:hypothetical protein